jgi:UDP-N-acetylglucosamine 2-epimerase (non-hydrolysing)
MQENEFTTEFVPAVPLKLTMLIGTRPEAIKMAPVVHSLKKDQRFKVKVLLSGQHTNLCTDALARFGIIEDRILDNRLENYTLAGQAAHFLGNLAGEMSREKTDLLCVHGDTTTGYIGAMAAFYTKTPVAHIEAGLRSHDLANPYPEEANRRLIAPICDLLFAPTPKAQANLLRENISKDRILVTGNTVVDAIQQMARQLPPLTSLPQFHDITDKGYRVILVTAHRRENWGRPMENICHALEELVEKYPDIAIIFPVHPNPKVREVVESVLRPHPRIRCTEPLDYEELMIVLRDSYLVLTDSGGIQEEAPSMGTPTLILREVTERPEAVEAGVAKLVGTDQQALVAEAGSLLDNTSAYERMVSQANPFGDGRASERIRDGVMRWCQGLPQGGNHWAPNSIPFC